jgi:hypothetical protein
MNFVVSLIFGWYCSIYAKPIYATYTVRYRATALKVCADRLHLKIRHVESAHSHLAEHLETTEDRGWIW